MAGCAQDQTPEQTEGLPVVPLSSTSQNADQDASVTVNPPQSQTQVLAPTPTMNPVTIPKSTPVPAPKPTPAPAPKPTPAPAPKTTPTPVRLSVSIANFAFSPSTISVKAGTTVTWTNKDSVPHTATSDTGAFDSGTLLQGKSFSFTFKTAGTFSYHCSVHPMMKATVTVK